MREVLHFLEGKRLKFQGVVKRIGTRSSFKGPDLETILVKNITLADRDTVICDHVWLTKRKRLAEVKAGDIIQFEARVGKYLKGYKGHRFDVYKPTQIDYRLDRPSKVEVTGSFPVDEIKDFYSNFSVNLLPPKGDKEHKDDWSNFFLDNIRVKRKILPNDLKKPIGVIILSNLENNKCLKHISERICDFKRWVKSFNESCHV